MVTYGVQSRRDIDVDEECSSFGINCR